MDDDGDLRGLSILVGIMVPVIVIGFALVGVAEGLFHVSCGWIFPVVFVLVWSSVCLYTGLKK